MIHLNGLLVVAAVGFGCGCILTEVCPPKWHRYGESCYFIIKDRMDWYEANRTCAELRANLAVPNSPSEQEYMLGLVPDTLKVNLSNPIQLWIGCNDIEEEGKWKHCPLRGKNDSYENWGDDQPSGTYDNSVNCAVFWYTSGKWHDRRCTDDTNYAVCELPVGQTPEFCKRTGPDDRLTPRCLLHHAMAELSDGKSCRSRSRFRCHSFNLPKQN